MIRTLDPEQSLSSSAAGIPLSRGPHSFEFWIDHGNGRDPSLSASTSVAVQAKSWFRSRLPSILHSPGFPVVSRLCLRHLQLSSVSPPASGIRCWSTCIPVSLRQGTAAFWAMRAPARPGAWTLLGSQQPSPVFVSLNVYAVFLTKDQLNFNFVLPLAFPRTRVHGRQRLVGGDVG